jgi:hypothetical protein
MKILGGVEMKLVLAVALVAASALPAHAADKTDAEKYECDGMAHAIVDEEPMAAELTQFLDDGHMDRMQQYILSSNYQALTGSTKAAADKYEAARKALVASLWKFRQAASEASGELTACSGHTGSWIEFE